MTAIIRLSMHTSHTSHTTPTRTALFDTWLQSIQATYALQIATLRPASEDASFRRYFRIDSTLCTTDKHSSPIIQKTFIIMDAPPELENSQPFVHIAQLMHDAGVAAPQVLAWDQVNGFLLLTDLGEQTMMQAIESGAPALPLFLQATDLLVQWQLASRPDVLPVFDADRQRQEMALYRDWYVNNRAQLGKAPETPYALTEADEKILTDTFEKLIAHNQQWPNVYVHSDFMPRNLMVSSEKMGVLDFQDAVYGPITYDIASLMRDAFWSCEEEEVLDVTIRYWSKARKAGLPVGDDFGAFYQAVEWMSLQRHLRIVGTFARLSLRDGKSRYAEDIPRFIDYIRSTCSRYMELKPLLRLVERVEGIAVPNMFAFGRT